MADADMIPTPETLVSGLKMLLDVEEIDTDLYRGPRLPGGRGRVFGGQVIAQALMAGSKSTVPERVAHSLHAYFMRPGDEEHPIIYRVERDHDGGSFSARRIIAFQHGKPILNMAASFQTLEPGFEHQVPMPEVPMPEDLIDEAIERQQFAESIPEQYREWFLRPRPFEMRQVESQDWKERRKTEARQHVWIRAAAPVNADAAMHRAMLAYASDMYLLGTATRPHGVSWMADKLQTASLDHAVWIHGDIDMNDWLLYATDSPWAGRGRGFNRGSIFTRDGRLVASVSQEGLIRNRTPKPD